MTSDTSVSVNGFEAINLIENLENRSCSDFLAVANNETLTNFDTSDSSYRISSHTCFKTTYGLMLDKSYKMIIGFEFPEPVFIHAVTHI